MAQNPFSQSPFDAIANKDEEDSALLPGQQATTPAPKMPEVKAPKQEAQAPQEAPKEGRRPKTDNWLPPSDLRPIFEAKAQEYDVPANVLMALGHQESRYNARAIGQPTEWGRAKGMMQYLDSTAKGMGINPFDAVQSIDAAAKQIRERLDKGYSMEDAVKEHFAGPDRKKWGAKTAAYGREVMEKAYKIGGIAMEEAPQTARADTPADIPADWIRLTPEQAAEIEARQAGTASGTDTPQQQGIDDRGFFDRAGDAASHGYSSMVQSLDTARFAVAGGDSAALAKSLADKFAKDQQRAQQKTTGEKEIDQAFADVSKAEGAWDTTVAGLKAVGTALANPKDLAVEVVGQAPNMLPSLAAGAAGAGVGAAAGAGGALVAGQLGPQVVTPEEVVTVPLAAASGAIWGGRGGMVAGTTAVELGAEVEQMIHKQLEHKKLQATAKNIQTVLDDPEFIASARNQGAAKGLTVGVIDQLFMGLGGKIAGKATSAATKTGKVALGTGAVATDAAGEVVGEAASQKVARGEVDAGDALREGVMGVGQSVVEPAVGGAMQAARSGIKAAQNTPERQVADEINRQVAEVEYVGQDAAARAAMDPNNEAVNPADTRMPGGAAPAPADAQAPAAPAAPVAPAAQPAPAPVKPSGPLSGALEKVADDGEFSATIQGEDGQTYTYTDEGGLVPVNPPAAGPMTAALEGVAAEQDGAPGPAPAPEVSPAPVPAEASVAPEQGELPMEPATDAAPAEDVPARAPDAPLSEMSTEDLRARLKYIAQQAKSSGGWNKMFVNARKAVEREINRRATDDARAPVDGAAVPDLATTGPAAVNPANESGAGGAAAAAPVATDTQPALTEAAKDAHAGKWFGSREKADAYLTKKKAGETHEIVQTGKVRFEVKPKQVAPADAAPQVSTLDAAREKHARQDEEVRKAAENIARRKAEKEAIDAAAHEAATSDTNGLPQPTEAQQEAGNYKKGHVSVQGLDIAIENPKGSKRTGTDPDGKAWETTMNSHYGYIKRTEGADGDHVDVFVGDKPDAQTVFIVDQANPATQAFDEHKVMVGFDSMEEAKAAYLANYDKDWKGKGFKAISALPVGEFKEWLASGDTTKPFAPISIKAKGKEPAPAASGKVPEVAPAEPPKQGRDTMGELGAMEEDAGGGFKKNDRAVAIIQKAAENLTPAAKGKVTRIINTHTKVEKDGTRLIKPDFYTAISDAFAYVGYMLNDAIDESGTKKEAANDSNAIFAGNKLFTADKVEAARARMRSKLTQINSGLDPELVMDGMTIAGAYIEAGTRKFSAYAKAMTDDFGDAITPYLLSFYEAVRHYPGLDTDGMSTPEVARKAHEAMLAESADVAKSPTSPTMDNKEAGNEPKQLDQRGARPLAGVPADEIQGTAADGQARAGAQGGGRADAPGNERTGKPGNDDARSLGDGARDVPVSEGGGAGSRGAKPVREPVQRGDGDPVGDGGNRGVTPAAERAGNYTVDPAEIGQGGAKTKYKNNLAAVRLLKQLTAEGRQATRAEQDVLAKYVGWGGIPQAFERSDKSASKGWEAEVAELKATLTAEEYAAAEASTRNAHYTSPEIVAAMWQAMRRLGFNGGRVLEPSVGVGNFFGLMPADMRSGAALHGVELDHITGGIAKHLYPQAKIASPMGFQDYTIPDGHFDAAIGNPPFGSEKLYDGKRRDLSGFSIHNYFFAKSIDGLKPNGVLAMVVTNRMMDVAGDKARQYIAKRAELLGAIRLPNNAFMANAGTEVTTDIIFLRKLAEGEKPTGESWMKVADYQDKAGKTVPLNEYFVRHPEMMLGDFGAYGSMYSPDDPALVAREGQDTPALLAAAIARLPSSVAAAKQRPPVVEKVVQATAADNVKVGSMYLAGKTVMVREPDSLGETQAKAVEFASDKAKERVVGMIAVRDALSAVRALQLDRAAKPKAIEAARAKLNAAYDAFVKDNGPINLDANKRLFRDDPTWPQISALEEGFDKGLSPAVAKKTGEEPRKPSATKAAIFTRRTQSPYAPPTSASSAKDALVTSLSETGRVDLDLMERLYGKDAEEITKELGDLVFEVTPGDWVTREEYLSGNVKRRLALTRELAAKMPRFARNVAALEAVQPTDIEAVDINVKVGAHWLPVEVMNAFANHIAEGTKARLSYNSATAGWTVIDLDGTPAARQRFQTGRVSLSKIIESAANQKTIAVYDQHPDGTRTLNETETQLANDKANQVKEEWSRWIWQDDARREALSRLYNDTFNTDVPREYDGSHLTFPGKVGDDIIRLRPHQANAVWRITQSGTTLADHVVGAGKTFTLIAAAMELRRMGLAKKPAFVVPNHLVGQWAADFNKLYPGANVLAASKADFEKANRKRLFARIATGDWDAVIVAHSSFGKVEVDPKEQAAFIEEQIADLMTSMESVRAAEGKGSRNVKKTQEAITKLREKLKALFDAENKDDSLYWNELGIDAVFVDEAHEFKNLTFSSAMNRVAGLGNQKGSQKAADMFMKIRQTLKSTGGRNVVFATGTPISNTMAEMYTMQRYLDYDTMKDQGLSHFDAWARMYGEVVTDWELSPSGQYKMNSRFAKFVNMPELMQRYTSFADVINRDDINRMLAVQGKKLPVPKVKGGKPQNLVVERSPAQARYIGEPVKDADGNDTDQFPEGTLVWRSENLPKKAEKGADNMLKVMGDARKAALDMRLIDPNAADYAGSKVNVAAGKIKAIYDRTAADRGTQLVFIDLSTPKAAKGKEAQRIRDLLKAADEGDDAAIEALDKMSPDELSALESDFSVYDDLKAKLIAQGIPENEIAFIHDAGTELQKEELFGKVRSGRVRVMLGSTAKMGAGMNVQDRLVALHHLDAPWRPSDLEQREGRIIRQGNRLYERDPENFEVEILRYATKQTLDSRMWQTIEGKANFIEQVRKGTAGAREIEDVAGEAANSAEMKAASSGNPLILEEMTLRQQIKKLETERSGHEREQHRLRDTVRSAERLIEYNEAKIAELTADAKLEQPAEFAITVGGKVFDKRAEAGEAILAQAETMGAKNRASIGSYGGFDLQIERVGVDAYVAALVGTGEYETNNFTLSADPQGIAQRVVNAVKDLDGEVTKLQRRVEQSKKDIPALQKQAAPWGKSADLEQAKQRHSAVLDQLKPKKKEQPKAEDKPAEEPRYSVSDDRAAEAIARVMAAKEGEVIVTHPEIGDIAVAYGDAKSGLAHIARRRGAAFIGRLPALLASGQVYEKPNQTGRVFIGNDVDEAVIRLEWNGEKKTWLLSAYEKHPDLAPAAQDARRSQETGPHTGNMRRATLRRSITGGVIGNVVAAMIDAGIVVLHDGPATLPKGMGKNIKGIQAATMPDGTVHLVASNLSEKNARAVMLHEAFHQGGEKLIGTARWGEMMGRLGSLYRQSEQSSGKAREFFDRARERVAAAKAKGAVSVRMEVEEFAAYAIEEYETNRDGMPAAIRKWVEDLIGLVKAWMLQRYGKQIGQVTPAQLAAMAKWAIMDVAVAKRGEMFGPIGELFSVADNLTIEVDGVRRPIRDSEGNLVGEDFAAQLAFWRAYDGPLDSEGRAVREPVRYSVAATDAPADTATEAAAKPDGLTPPEQGLLRRVQASIQDNMNRVKQVQERIMEVSGRTVLGKSDYYGAETNRPGRIAARLEDARDNLTGPLMERLAESGYKPEQLSELLHAMHAKERNEAVAKINDKMPDGGSGMTTADAEQVLRKYEKARELHALADQARAIARATLDLKLAYGLLKQEDHEVLSEMYKHYVPLKGDGEFGPKVKRAMGHEERDEHILENIARDYDQAVVVGEKNLARQSLLRMALQFPDKDLWTVGVPPRGRYVAGKVFNIVKDGETVASLTSQSQASAFLEAKGPHAVNYEVQDSNGERVAEFVKPLQDNEVMVYVKGEPVRIQIFDEKLASQLRPLDGAKLHVILEKMRGVNQYLSKIYTGYNPAFILRNTARDAMTGTINMLGNEGLAVTAKAWSKYPKAIKAMGQWAATKKAPAGKIGDYLTEYRMHGGKVGASWMSDLEQQGKSLQRMYDDAYGAGNHLRDGKTGKAALVAGRKVVGGMAHVIEIANQATENALRLSLYIALREEGASPGRAAQAAKSVTVDFDRKGATTGALGAIYLFFNPAIQGSANAIKTLVKGAHRQQAWAALGGLALLGVYAASQGMDDDEDKWLGEGWETRTRNLMLNVGGYQIRVPLSQEYAPVYAFGVAVAEALRGQGAMKSAAHLVSSFIDAYFPLNGAYKVDSDNHALDLGMAAVPTVIKPVMESAVNRNVFGSEIVPESEFTKDRPDNLKMFRGTKNTAYDKAAQGIASAGEMLGAGKYENDITKVSPETLKSMWRTYTGGLGQFVTDSLGVASMAAADPAQVEAGDVPIVKDFVRNADIKPLRGRYYSLAREAQKAITEFDQAKKAGDGDAMDKLLSDPEKSRLVSLGRMVRQTTRAAAAIRDEEVDINADKTMGQADKRAALKAIEEQEEALYRSAIEAFK